MFGAGERDLTGSQGTGGEGRETRERGKAVLKNEELSEPEPAPVEKA